jgi:hypothetical protein
METVSRSERPARSRVARLAALAMMVIAAPLFAQGTIIGTVFGDSANRRVPNADVSIASLGKSVRTDGVRGAPEKRLRTVPHARGLRESRRAPAR